MKTDVSLARWSRKAVLTKLGDCRGSRAIAYPGRNCMDSLGYPAGDRIKGNPQVLGLVTLVT